MYLKSIFILAIKIYLHKYNMSHNRTQLKILRGTDAQNNVYVGADGEVTADMTNFTLRLHDGVTPGGHIIGSGSEGGGGGGTYTNTTPVPTTLGGVVAGTTFTNVPITQVFDQLLYPYQAPAFTAFTMSGSSGTPQPTILEVGATLVGETKTFNWSTSNQTNISANSISILDFTGNTIIASSLANTGPATGTVAAVTNTSATSHIYRITGSNTQNVGFSRDFTVSWRWRIYWGTGSFASATASDITGSLISSSLVTNSTGTFNFGAGGYKYIAYPTVFGQKFTFKDVNTGFDVDMQDPTTVSITNTNSATTNYFVHRSTNILGGTLTIVVS
jgi:hypothetical protein